MTNKNSIPKDFSILLDFSHEIRNPLNGISGLIDILLDTPLNPDQKSLIQNLHKNSNQLQQTLELMLDYSKITNGMIKYSQEQVFIYPFLQKELGNLFKSFNKSRIKFCYYIPPELNGIAVFDPFIISQIIKLSSQKLLLNLKKSKLILIIESTENSILLNYSTQINPESKAVETDNHHIKIIQNLMDEYLKFIGGKWNSEENNGNYIFQINIPIKCSPADVNYPAIEKKNLFKEKKIVFFNYQSDSCESIIRYLEYLGMKLFKHEKSIENINEIDLDQKYHLIGIDISPLSKHEFQIMDDFRSKSQLPIIMFKESDTANQKILTLQKDVVVMYKPISPNNLSFVLDAVLNSQADQLREWVKNPISILADYHNSLKILIADDEPINQRVLREYLSKLHLKADFVNNGAKAIEQYKNNRYDLLFMDIQMPIMDGVEATKEIRKIKNNHHPYIVAITADALKGGKQKYLNVGMNDYLLKPINLEGITQVIQKYIDSFTH